MHKKLKYAGLFTIIICGLALAHAYKKKRQSIPTYWWMNILKSYRVASIEENKRKQKLKKIEVLDVWEYEISDDLLRLTVLITSLERFFIYELVWDKNIVSELNKIKSKDFSTAVVESCFKEVSSYEAKKWHNDSYLGI